MLRKTLILIPLTSLLIGAQLSFANPCEFDDTVPFGPPPKISNNNENTALATCPDPNGAGPSDASKKSAGTLNQVLQFLRLKKIESKNSDEPKKPETRAEALERIKQLQTQIQNFEPTKASKGKGIDQDYIKLKDELQRLFHKALGDEQMKRCLLSDGLSRFTIVNKELIDTRISTNDKFYSLSDMEFRIKKDLTREDALHFHGIPESEIQEIYNVPIEPTPSTAENPNSNSLETGSKKKLTSKFKDKFFGKKKNLVIAKGPDDEKRKEKIKDNLISVFESKIKSEYFDKLSPDQKRNFAANVLLTLGKSASDPHPTEDEINKALEDPNLVRKFATILLFQATQNTVNEYTQNIFANAMTKIPSNSPDKASFATFNEPHNFRTDIHFERLKPESGAGVIEFAAQPILADVSQITTKVYFNPSVWMIGSKDLGFGSHEYPKGDTSSYEYPKGELSIFSFNGHDDQKIHDYINLGSTSASNKKQ